MDRPEILDKVDLCLYDIYGFHFTEARQVQSEINELVPEHPVSYFLQALLIYWQNFPLLPGDPEVENFEKSIDMTIALSKPMIESNEFYTEGVFFDMHARAYRSMFWADNGKSAKVLPDLDNMYRNTIKGIDLKESFADFYFSSGLYNYYVDAYVEAHPVYKPVASLFRKGNRAEGLKELEIAIDRSRYIKYEAILFMSLIQLNYDRDLGKAEDYAASLYNFFPDNIYFLGQYLIILLHNKNYMVASVLSNKLKQSGFDFDRMIFSMTSGFIQENQQHNTTEARRYYQETIDLADRFGPIADLYASIAYAGLSRIANQKGQLKEAKKYSRISRQLSSYEFIRDFE